MATQTYTTPGSFAFDCTGKLVSAVRVWGQGGGGGVDSAGGGGGFAGGRPSNSPASLAVVVVAGNPADTSPGSLSNSTRVEWDSGASYLKGGAGDAGLPGSVTGDGNPGVGSSAGHVTAVTTHAGGIGETVFGGGGAGSLGNALEFPEVPQPEPGPPDGGAGGTPGVPNGAAPGGGGVGNQFGGGNGAGGDGRVEIDYVVITLPTPTAVTWSYGPTLSLAWEG